MIWVNAGVIKADSGGLDGAAIQLQCAEVEGHSLVGLGVLQHIQPCAVRGAVEDKVALHRSVQDEAVLAPAEACRVLSDL